MSRHKKPTTNIQPRKLNAIQQELNQAWLIKNQNRIAELDAIISRSSGNVVLSNYARAK